MAEILALPPVVWLTLAALCASLVAVPVGLMWLLMLADRWLWRSK